jgi:hypothetical protein
VRNEEALLRVEEEKNFPQTIQGSNAKWIGHIWGRNCLLKNMLLKERYRELYK